MIKNQVASLKTLLGFEALRGNLFFSSALKTIERFMDLHGSKKELLVILMCFGFKKKDVSLESKFFLIIFPTFVERK